MPGGAQPLPPAPSRKGRGSCASRWVGHSAACAPSSSCCAPLTPGLRMVTARDPDDSTSPRVARHLPRFAAAPPPEPPDDWASWAALLADRSGPPESQLNIAPRVGFGTVCSALAAVGEDGAAV